MTSETKMDDKDYEILGLKIALSKTTVMLHQQLLLAMEPALAQEQQRRAMAAMPTVPVSKENGDGLVGD